MSKFRLFLKKASAFLVLCVGGPVLVWYVSPTDEEIFKKYNPELQKRSLENRQERKEEYVNFLLKLKELSQSDRSIWEEAKIQAAKEKANKTEEQRRQAIESQKRREEIKKQSLVQE